MDNDGTEVKTESNAGWVYGLSSCLNYEGKRITFKYKQYKNSQIMTDFINSK